MSKHILANIEKQFIKGKRMSVSFRTITYLFCLAYCGLINSGDFCSELAAGSLSNFSRKLSQAHLTHVYGQLPHIGIPGCVTRLSLEARKAAAEKISDSASSTISEGSSFRSLVEKAGTVVSYGAAAISGASWLFGFFSKKENLLMAGAAGATLAALYHLKREQAGMRADLNINTGAINRNTEQLGQVEAAVHDQTQAIGGLTTVVQGQGEYLAHLDQTVQSGFVAVAHDMQAQTAATNDLRTDVQGLTTEQRAMRQTIVEGVGQIRILSENVSALTRRAAAAEASTTALSKVIDKQALGINTLVGVTRCLQIGITGLKADVGSLSGRVDEAAAATCEQIAAFKNETSERFDEQREILNRLDNFTKSFAASSSQRSDDKDNDGDLEGPFPLQCSSRQFVPGTVSIGRPLLTQSIPSAGSRFHD